MDKRPTYKRVASTAADMTLACCRRCEWCDIRLTMNEQVDYRELGSAAWRDTDGNIEKSSGDRRRLICTLSGQPTSGDECCPEYRCAAEQWV